MLQECIWAPCQSLFVSRPAKCDDWRRAVLVLSINCFHPEYNSRRISQDPNDRIPMQGTVPNPAWLIEALDEGDFPASMGSPRISCPPVALFWDSEDPDWHKFLPRSTTHNYHIEGWISKEYQSLSGRKIPDVVEIAVWDQAEKVGFRYLQLGTQELNRRLHKPHYPDGGTPLAVIAPIDWQGAEPDNSARAGDYKLVRSDKWGPIDFRGSSRLVFPRRAWEGDRPETLTVTISDAAGLRVSYDAATNTVTQEVITWPNDIDIECKIHPGLTFIEDGFQFDGRWEGSHSEQVDGPDGSLIDINGSFRDKGQTEYLRIKVEIESRPDFAGNNVEVQTYVYAESNVIFLFILGANDNKVGDDGLNRVTLYEEGPICSFDFDDTDFDVTSMTEYLRENETSVADIQVTGIT